MNKQDAVKQFVNRDFSGIPLDWIQIIIEHNGGYNSLPMWGTMWIIEERFIGEKLWESAVEMQKDNPEKPHFDEEMAGEMCITNKDGEETAVFIYDIDDQYVIGVNGAGWSFYDGVWDQLYDKLKLKWHDDEKDK